MGTTRTILIDPVYNNVIFTGNYFGNAGAIQYTSCKSCSDSRVSVFVSIEIDESINGFMPNKRELIFNSPNFGLSFYDTFEDNGIQFFPTNPIINDGIPVVEQINLSGVTNPYDIQNLAVGLILSATTDGIPVSVSVSINGVLSTQRIFKIEPSFQDFGVQLGGLFDPRCCVQDPCNRTITMGNTIEIVIKKIS